MTKKNDYKIIKPCEINFKEDKPTAINQMLYGDDAKKPKGFVKYKKPTSMLDSMLPNKPKAKITTTKSTKPITIKANNKTKDVTVHTPFFDKPKYTLDNLKEELMKDPEFKEEYEKEKKYTIEDLKTKKIAVHLETGEAWQKLTKFFERNKESYVALAFNVYCFYHKKAKFFQTLDKKACIEQGYTIITLKDLEGLEPTAEEGKQKTKNIGDDWFFRHNDGTAEIKLDYDIADKVIIKLGDKEKVITRDDFEDEWEINKVLDKLTMDALTYGTSISRVVTDEKNGIKVERVDPQEFFTKDLGYAEGSFGWAMLKAFGSPRKYVSPKNAFTKFIGDKDGDLVNRQGEKVKEYDYDFANLLQSKWEEREEEPKTTTLREALKQKKRFTWKGERYDYVPDWDTFRGYTATKPMDLKVIINNLDAKVIIKE